MINEEWQATEHLTQTKAQCNIHRLNIDSMFTYWRSVIRTAWQRHCTTGGVSWKDVSCMVGATDPQAYRMIPVVQETTSSSSWELRQKRQLSFDSITSIADVWREERYLILKRGLILKLTIHDDLHDIDLQLENMTLRVLNEFIKRQWFVAKISEKGWKPLGKWKSHRFYS